MVSWCNSMPTIQELLHWEEKNISRFEIELLLAHALKKTRVFVLAHPEYQIANNTTKKFSSLIERRKNHEPIALITGHKEFFGREFFVNRHTLVPRPETELLVEKTLEHIIASSKKKFPMLVIDIGTGSGNIITTLVKELAQKNISEKIFSFIATDISREALRIAKKNAKRHGTEKNIRFIRSDLFKNIPKKIFRDAQEIIITANLPYLSKEEYAATPPDVQDYEPHSALESGIDGLDHYRKLLKELRHIAVEKTIPAVPITLFLEISPSQKNSLQRLVQDIFPKANIIFFRDLAQKWRLAKINITTPR